MDKGINNNGYDYVDLGLPRKREHFLALKVKILS